MKTLLIEAGLVVGAIIFWAVALPVTTMFFAAASLCYALRPHDRPERRPVLLVHRPAPARA